LVNRGWGCLSFASLGTVSDNKEWLDRLKGMFGHSSKAMVYEVYGKYVTGIEKDTGQIRGYYGSVNLERETGSAGAPQVFHDFR